MALLLNDITFDNDKILSVSNGDEVVKHKFYKNNSDINEVIFNCLFNYLKLLTKTNATRLKYERSKIEDDEEYKEKKRQYHKEYNKLNRDKINN